MLIYMLVMMIVVLPPLLPHVYMDGHVILHVISYLTLNGRKKVEKMAIHQLFFIIVNLILQVSRPFHWKNICTHVVNRNTYFSYTYTLVYTRIYVRFFFFCYWAVALVYPFQLCWQFVMVVLTNRKHEMYPYACKTTGEALYFLTPCGWKDR